MGNQPSRQVSEQQRKMQQNILSHVQMTEESTPQKTWIASEKTVEDLRVLMREDIDWDRILRSFLRKITSKYQYQKYLRAVLEQILEWGYRDIGQSTSKTDQIRREATQNSNEEAGQQQNHQIRKQANNQQQPSLMSHFQHYKTLLEASYLISWHQSLQHQSPIQQLLLPLLPQPLPQVMLSQLFAFPSVKQKHMDELFVELNLRAFSSLRELARLIVEEFVVVEDQFALEKFVVGKEVMGRALAYAEISCKMLGEHERAAVYEEIRRLKQDSLKPYIEMCRQFISYKNVHCASLIIQNLIVKGHHLTQHQLSFYFYISIYQMFLYQLNFTTCMLLNPVKISHQPIKPSDNQSITPAPKNPSTLHPSFICFPQLQHLNYDKIIQMFLLVRPYNQLQLVKKCFQTTYGLYQPEKGTSLFLLSLKQYVFSQNCHLSTAVECLRGYLMQLSEEAKGELQQKLIDKLAVQAMTDLLQYERHLIEILKVYRFGKENIHLIRTIFKVINILNKFEVTAKITDLLQLLHQGPTSYNQPHPHPIKPQPHTPQELQFLSLIMIKKVITKFLTFSQSRQQIVFIVQDKFESQSFQYSTKEIQSLFILTEYLHKDLFRPYVPLSQLHQLLFQHMLHFGKYTEVETMLKVENLNRYSIQPQVVKMIIGESVRELLIKSDKSISLIAQDVKKHIKLLQAMIGSQQRQQKQDSRQGQSHFQQSKAQQLQQLQSIRSLFKLLTKLDFYSVSLHQQQKQSISINLLYYLIQHYEHQIQVFNYDQLYRLIILIEGRHHDLVQHLMGNSASSSTTSSQTPITNEYLKFKIDLAHKAYEVGQLRFGEFVLKQVLAYQPPWISTEIIAIIKKSPQNISHDFINIAFEHCVKGQDLRFLLNLWKQRTCSPSQPQTLLQKGLKQQKKLTQLFESTTSFLVLQDSYINDQKEYRNLIAQMTFNDQVLKGKDYAMFFTLMGTEVERAFYMAYQKGLDLVKLDIVLKQGMKIGVFNISNVIKLFFKLLYFCLEEDKVRMGSKTSRKASYMRFKQTSLPQMLSQVQNLNSSQSLKSSLPYILLKKLHKPTLTFSLLPQPFLTNYIQSPLSLQPHPQHPQPAHTLLYKFLFDQPYRQKHLIALKDQPMGKGDIRVYREVCRVNGLNVMELSVFSLTNQLNTVSEGKVGQLLQDEKMQNTIQKLVTWTESSRQQSLQLINKLTTKLFSTSTLYCILSVLQSRQNPHLREILTQQHLTILSSLSKLQVNTQFHGLITQHFFQKPINGSNPKQKLSQKHIKILKKQLKLRNVFLLSKIMYFCYGMSVEVEKQVLKLFVKENQNQEERELFEQLKRKLQQHQEM